MKPSNPSSDQLQDGGRLTPPADGDASDWVDRPRDLSHEHQGDVQYPIVLQGFSIDYIAGWATKCNDYCARPVSSKRHRGFHVPLQQTPVYQSPAGPLDARLSSGSASNRRPRGAPPISQSSNLLLGLLHLDSIAHAFGGSREHRPCAACTRVRALPARVKPAGALLLANESLCPFVLVFTCFLRFQTFSRESFSRGWTIAAAKWVCTDKQALSDDVSRLAGWSPSVQSSIVRLPVFQWSS
ncbi:hypothetical protein BD414DRAFT_289523 [Trametes punicea]|nr:hypothetical protein BD414DRAFT_289523 [Trametes punicea]